MRRKEIRVQTLVLVAAVTGIIGFVVFAMITRSGSLVPNRSTGRARSQRARGGLWSQTWFLNDSRAS